MKRYRLEITEESPNGTSDLMIYDNRSGKLIEYIDDAIFGLTSFLYRTHDFRSQDLNPIITFKEAVEWQAVSPINPGGNMTKILKNYM